VLITSTFIFFFEWLIIAEAEKKIIDNKIIFFDNTMFSSRARIDVS